MWVGSLVQLLHKVGQPCPSVFSLLRLKAIVSEAELEKGQEQC